MTAYQIELDVRPQPPRTMRDAMRDVFRCLPANIREQGMDAALSKPALARCMEMHARTLLNKNNFPAPHYR